MSSGSSEVRARILNNARAALWEQFRNEALKLDATLAGDALEAAAKEVQRQKMADNGRKGRQSAAAKLAAADVALRLLPDVRDRLVEALALVDQITPDQEAA